MMTPSRQELSGESPACWDRRRRNRPETLRHMNGSLSRSLESDRVERFHAGAVHRRGAALHRSAQSLRSEGQRGEGTSVLVSLYSFARLQWA